jgi:predicted DNA-binding transcriptional regulator YafY
MSGRVANCIKMLNILRDKKIYKKEELAHLLDTNPRNIIEYRKDLYDAGYCIEFKNGKFGGYYLDSKCLIPVTSLSSNEMSALIRSYDFLRNTDFFHINDYNEALIKIKANFDSINILHESYINSAKAQDVELINKYYEIFSDAIANHYKVKIKYAPLQGKPAETIIHPYELIRYQNFWFLVARDESDDKKFKVYKLSKRMHKAQILVGEPFYFDEDFKVGDYIGQSSLIKLDTYDIEMEVYNEAAISISEKIIGINPEYRWENDTTLHLKTSIEGKYNAIALILSLGDNARLLKPEPLVDEISKTIKNMHQKYRANS